MENAKAKALSQRVKKSGRGPMLMKVITIDIKHDMKSEVKNASKTGAWR